MVQEVWLGVEDYLVKPFDILELLVRMEKVLDRMDRQPKQLTYQDIAVGLESQPIHHEEQRENRIAMPDLPGMAIRMGC